MFEDRKVADSKTREWVLTYVTFVGGAQMIHASIMIRIVETVSLIYHISSLINTCNRAAKVMLTEELEQRAFRTQNK
jgi:hypothetical protein